MRPPASLPRHAPDRWRGWNGLGVGGMDENDSRALTGEAQTNLLLRREAVRRAAAANANGSPHAVEVTLASISAEVMAEAIARRTKPPKSG